MFHLPATVEDIRQFHFTSRKAAFECIQLYHGSLHPPRKLKMIKENIGTRVTYCCVDKDCPVRVSLKLVSRDSQKSWIVYDSDGHKDMWTHGPLCECVVSLSKCVVSLSTKTAAHVLKDIDGNGRDLVLKARERGINLGGRQVSANDITINQMKAARRVKVQIATLNGSAIGDLICKLPSLLNEYKKSNFGAFTSLKFQENVLKSCLLVSQLSIIMFHNNYLRNLLAIDSAIVVISSTIFEM